MPQDNRFVVFNAFWQSHSSSNAEQRGVGLSHSSQWVSRYSELLAFGASNQYMVLSPHT